MQEDNKIDYDPIKSEAQKVSIKQASVSLINFLKNLFSIYDGVDKEKPLMISKTISNFQLLIFGF